MIDMKRVFLFVAGISLLPDSFIKAETSLIEKTAFTPPDLYSAAVKTFSILFIILAVILTAFYLLKRFWPRGLEFMGRDQWIRVIAATSIAPKKMVALVEVAGEILVLGLTGDQITMLTKVTDGKMIHHLKESQAKKTTGSPFYRNFKSLINSCGCEGEKRESLIHKIAGASRKDDQRIEEINIPGIKT
jgi:flagellar protein FliO/FliZ